MTSTIRSRFLMSAFSLVFLVPVAYGLQINARLSGPVVGYVFDAQSGTLRPVRGILGSATVGPPVNFGFTLSQALTLDARHLVASSDSSPEILSLNLETSPPSVEPIANVPSSSLLSAASLQGTSAAFYYPGAGVQIVTDLLRKPVASHFVDLSWLKGMLTRMAVSNDGGLLVYSVDEDTREALYCWTASSQNARFVMSAGSFGGLAITSNGDALVADRQANEVLAIRDVGAAAIPQVLAGPRDGVSNPAGIGIAAGNRIYVANAGSATLLALESTGLYIRTLYCDCEFSGLYPLRDSVFRLTDRLDRGIFLLDASSVEEWIPFIPALGVSK